MQIQSIHFRQRASEAIVDIPAHAPSTDSTRLAIAEIVVLEDVNGDGQLAVTGPRGNVSPDRYLASSHDVLAFIDRPFRSGIPSILTASGLARWQLVHYDCDGRLTKEVQGGGMADMVVLPSSSLNCTNRASSIPLVSVGEYGKMHRSERL